MYSVLLPKVGERVKLRQECDFAESRGDPTITVCPEGAVGEVVWVRDDRISVAMDQVAGQATDDVQVSFQASCGDDDTAMLSNLAQFSEYFKPEDPNEPPNKIPVRLFDASGDGGGPDAHLFDPSGTIWIHVDGYGTSDTYDGDGYPIGLEVYEGELRVLTWPDINDDNVKAISMEGARETERYKRYLWAVSEHMWSNGQKEDVRWLYDQDRNEMLYVQVPTGQASSPWKRACDTAFADVVDDVVRSNNVSPDNFSLCRCEELPVWAQALKEDDERPAGS